MLTIQSKEEYWISEFLLSILYRKPDSKAVENPHLCFRDVALITYIKAFACLDYLGYIS